MHRPKGGPADRPMSIEAMLDMERKEVLALLENRAQSNPSPETDRRSASPNYAGPRSPVRSMLDVVDEGIASGSPASPARQGPVRSMLDTDSPPPAPRPMPTGRSTAPNSPGLPPEPALAGVHHRSGSDAAFKPVDYGGPRMPSASRNDPTSGYQFSGIYNSLGGGQHVPRRTQSQKKPGGGSLGEALRGSDLSSLPFPGDRGRNPSISGLGSRLGNKSKSPHGRLNRSRSPATFSPMLAPGKAYLDDGRVLDINSAYRRLSDANLAYSSGSLSQLPLRKRSDDPASGRLVKDYLGPDGEHLGSSEEDEPYSTDDEDRGRKKTPRPLNPDAKGGNESKSRSRSNRGERKTLSLLAAAEEERTTVAAQQPQYQYRSLIEPEIKITNSSGDTVKPAKGAVHPHTSFDHNPGSATPSMIDSDEEADIDDIKRAQKLSFSMTNIVNSPEAHRSVRVIYRGEYNKIAQAAEEEHRRLRKYLVATDVSEESTHALEWAIGTVLRDGDTLVAIYCVDEETGIDTGDQSSLPDDAKKQAAAVNSITSAKIGAGPTTPVSEFISKSAFHRRGDSSGTPAASPAPSGRYDKAEEERQHAVRDITDRVLRLLRKTQLQVRVVVEVLHCKNPKHLITEVIDLVSPTLVVIGSRGRSALKGVILGSFSNYLVTKSSVPVMVARKRLRKQSKYKRTAVRQVNNLSNPAARSLANAKID